MNRILYVGAVGLLAISACTSNPPKKVVKYAEESPKINTTKPTAEDPDIHTRMLAQEEGTKFVTEIKFRAGSSRLSNDAKEKIKSLYQKANQDGDIKEVRVVTWADMEYPSEEKKELPEWQQKLAEKRNDNLERALKSYDDEMKVTTVSMAERIGTFDHFSAPTSAEVKESMEDADIATTSPSDNNPSYASHSIVMFFLEK